MAAQQLESQDAQRPPIDGVRVALGLDELWRKVVGRTAGGVRLADDDLREAHVSQLHMPGFVQEQILRLQVSEDDLLGVQVLKREGRASDVETRAVQVAPEALLVVRCVQLSAEGKLEQEVERLVAVVRLIEIDDERGVAHKLNVLLAHDTALHARLDNVALAEGLQCIRLLRRGVLNHLHDAKATATQEAEPLELLADNLPEAIHLLLLLHLLHARCSCLPSLLQFLERAQQHVE
mmetsp:Transcript_21791/g.59534  ORF Transcript_21791/g.59534 Transcript_21791/m.59534 type:complete len:236 (-) Transcript_21791:1307-2014(-)